MTTEPELLNERLERLAMVLDEIMPNCALLVRDALELLKEQEAVEPKPVDLYGKDEWWGLVCVCPDCKTEWMSGKADTHFCPNCGRKVKWE